MRELSLHVLDIVQNSIRAKAKTIKIQIIEIPSRNKLSIIVEDDGVGMDKKFLERVSDPFITTRTTRRVGLGLSLLQAATQRCEGNFVIDSKEEIGTRVEAHFQYDHIDRAPLGDMGETIGSIILSLGHSELIYYHQYNKHQFIFDTREVKEILGVGVSIGQVEVIQWIKEYINEGVTNLYGGVNR